MCSRRLWNSHQRHKFLRATASRDILNLEFPKWFFQGFSAGTFHHGRNAVSSEYTQDWEECRRNVSGVPKHRIIRTFHINLNLFKYVFNVIQNWKTNALNTILFDGAYFLLAIIIIMVEGDESSPLRMAN